MLKTNLSTRPFYNERGVHWALAVAFAAIVALTVFNVTRAISLSARQATLSAEAQREEARVQQLNADATKVRGSIDQKALERVIASAKEANAIIDQRTFSWTELFNHFENTLPTGVMLTSVRPRIGKDELTIELTVLGREVEMIDDFIEKLEATGAFTGVLAGDEAVTETDEIQARITARYTPSSGGQGASGTPPPSGTEPGKEPAAGTQPVAATEPASGTQGAS